MHSAPLTQILSTIVIFCNVSTKYGAHHHDCTDVCIRVRCVQVIICVDAEQDAEFTCNQLKATLHMARTALGCSFLPATHASDGVLTGDCERAIDAFKADDGARFLKLRIVYHLSPAATPAPDGVVATGTYLLLPQRTLLHCCDVYGTAAVRSYDLVFWLLLIVTVYAAGSAFSVTGYRFTAQFITSLFC